jgi:hypothetical protein
MRGCAYAERWVLSARDECLNHLVLFGLDSLRRVVRRYKSFFNERRSRQGVGNRVSAATNGEGGQRGRGEESLGIVHGDEYLGGLLKSYRFGVRMCSLPSVRTVSARC